MLQRITPDGTIVVAFSFMSSALVTTAQHLKQLQQALADARQQLLFVAGGPHASGDAAGTLAMGFDVVFIGEGEYSFIEFLQHLAENRRDFQDIRGLAFATEDSQGKRCITRTGRPPLIELNDRYPALVCNTSAWARLRLVEAARMPVASARHRFFTARACGIGPWKAC